MKPKPLKILLIASLVCLGIEGMADLAEAVTMTTPIQTITFGPRAGDFGVTRTVDKFDPSLGTLSAVNIFLSGSITSVGARLPLVGRSIFCPEEGGDCRGSLVGQSIISTGLVGGPNLAVIIPLTRQDFVLAPGETVAIPSQMDTKTTINPDSTPPNFLAYTRSDILNQFIGAGQQVTLSMLADAETILTNTAGSAVGAVVVTSSGEAQIFYTYEAAPPVEIPEPSMLLGLGIIPLLGCLKKKN